MVYKTLYPCLTELAFVALFCLDYNQDEFHLWSLQLFFK